MLRCRPSRRRVGPPNLPHTTRRVYPTGTPQPLAAVEAIVEAMRELEPIPESRAAHLRSSEDLSGIVGERLATTSERMEKAVDVFVGLWGDEEPAWKAEAERCCSALKDREAVGCVSVLLVHQTAGEGLVSPVNAALQPGTGSSQTATPASPAFESAIDRARLALVSSRFLGPSTDAVLTGDLSDASYSGASVALGAAVAMYSCQNQLSVDPHTAFTGDIKLEGSEWRVRGVDGIAPKLRAAAEAGFRTVFLPAENEADIPSEVSDRIRVISVGTVTELILRLQLPAISAQAETLQLRKVRALEAGCVERGWQLGVPTPIQDGSQFTISPATPPELKVARAARRSRDQT